MTDGLGRTIPISQPSDLRDFDNKLPFVNQTSPANASLPSKKTIKDRPTALNVSAFDRTASLLIALLVLVGTTVTMLLVMWMSNKVFVSQEDVAIEYIEPLAAGNSQGDMRDLEEPGEEEVEDLTEPQMEETLDAVTDAISAQRATLESFEGEARSSTKGKGGSGKLGEGGTADIIPRWQRWEILFTTSTMNVYAEQLDFFNIELAAVGGGSPTIDYASQLSRRNPATRRGKADEEDRIYFAWRKGKLQSADKQLLSKAGISTSGKVQVQFYPANTVNMLAGVERAYAGDIPLEGIAKTVFGVKTDGNQHSFFVIEQRRRRGH